MNFIFVFASIMMAGYSLKTPLQKTEYVRRNYAKSVSNKNLCQMLIHTIQNDSGSVLLAYAGALNMIWAKHIFNPIDKIETFFKGRNQLEQAVKKDSNNIEIRFVRYSIQAKCPAFLRYHRHKEEDKKFLIENKKHLNNKELLNLIEPIL